MSLSSQLPGFIDFSVIPKCFTERYEGRQADLEDWLIRFYFWRRWQGRENQIEDTKLQARAIAEAKIAALDNALELEQVSSEVALSLLVDANAENWYQYAEVSDLLEFLHDRLEGYMDHIEAQKAMGKDVRMGSVYEVNNLIKVVTTLASMGIPKEDIIPIRHNLSKAKYASGYMMRVLESDLSQGSKEREIYHILKQVSDPNVSVKDFLEKRNRAELESRTGTPPIDGQVSVIRDGEMLYIRSPNTAFTRAIQHSLKGLVNGWSPIDAVALITQLTEEISVRTKYKPTRLVNGHLAQGGDTGILLPSPEQFRNLAIQEIGRNSFLIDQALDNKTVIVPVLNFGRPFSTHEERDEFLQQEFQFISSNPFDEINKAFQEFYSIPEVLTKAYDITGLQLIYANGFRVCLILEGG